MNEKNENFHNIMTESYSEISNFLTSTTSTTNNSSEISDSHLNEANNLNIENKNKILNKNDKNNSEKRNDDNDDDGTENTTNSVQKRPKSLICVKTFPYNLEGTVSRDGDMTHFVAENLEYKIKLSSPITKKDIYQGSSSKNSTPSSLSPHNFLYTQFSQIDSNVLSDIEIEAQYLAASIDNLTENLCNLLHSVSSITADNIEIHKSAVNKLTDCMDANIKCMYTIMAKTEEISKSMKPTEQLAVRIREIKKLVDMLESNL